MVQDSGSGLASISHVETNAVTLVPFFVPGDTSPVVVDSTKIIQTLPSSLKLTVTDVAGNVTVCDPVVPGSLRKAHYAGAHRLSSRARLYLANLRRVA